MDLNLANETLPDECWKVVGIWGDRLCPELAEYVHCRNCPAYGVAGRQLLDRPPPLDYLDEMTERVAHIPDVVDQHPLKLLVFRVGGAWLALPSMVIEKTLAPAPVIPIPGRSNRHFLGLVNTLGELRLCLTLEHFIESESESEPLASLARVFPRMLIVKLEGDRWVFPADEVIGTLDWQSQQLDSVPSNLQRSQRGLVSGLFVYGGRRVALLNEKRLASLMMEALA